MSEKNIDIKVSIGGKDFTMEEAEEIYNKLKELFEVTVVGTPYPVPYTFRPYWESIPYELPYATNRPPLINWDVINTCLTDNEE